MKRLWLTLGLTIVASVAVAHPAPFSYFDLYLDDGGLSGAVVVHDFDAAHELGLEKPEALLDVSSARSHQDTLARLLAARFRITFDGQPLTPKWRELEVLAERQSLRLAFELESRRAAQLGIDAWLFPYDGNHQTFVNVYEDGQLKQQAVLDGEHRSLSYYSGSLQGRWAVVRTFAAAGVQHILIGPDHILFLLGLLLLGGSAWRLASIVTAFTLGHSLTLSLASLGWIQVTQSFVEPLIALSIVVVGVDNLLVRQQRRLPAGEASPALRDLRPWLAAGFGLIHGFGFAAVLQELGLPRAALGWSLAAFNLGVELGQLALVLVIAALLAGVRRHSMALAERCAVLGSVAVIAAGAYWFVQRIWFTSVT